MPLGTARFVAFVVVVAAVAAALWGWAQSGQEPPVGTTTASSPAGRTAAAPAGSPADASREAAAPAEALAAVAAVTVRGRCLAAEDGTPIAASLRVVLDDGSDERLAAASASQLAAANTDAEGRFACQVPLAVASDLRIFVEAPLRAPVSGRRMAVAPGSEWDVGEVRLVGCARVRGEVVDTTGAQVAGAEVMLVMIGLDQPALAFRESHVAITDARGAFVIADAVAAGEWYVRVDRTGALRTPRKTQVPAGGEHVVPIEVERPDPALSIRGKVVDRSGAPMPGVRLAAHGEGARGNGISDADGTFTVPKGPPHFDRGQTGVELQAQREGVEQERPAKDQLVHWGQRDVVVVMRPLTDVVVRAVDSRGGVVWPFQVILGKVSANGESWAPFATPRQQAGTDRVVLRQLASGEHTLLLQPVAAALALAGPVRFQVGEQAPRELVVPVPDRILVRVDVVDTAGAPVPGCTLELVASLVAAGPDANAPAVEIAALRSPTGRPLRQFVLATAISDAEGHATIEAPPGSWLLRTSCRTHLPESRTIPVAAGAASLRIVLTAAGVVRGRLVPADVLPALGLGEPQPGRRLTVVARAGKAELARAEVTADGTFVLGPLPPGIATLQLASWLAANEVHAAVVLHHLGEVDGTGALPIEREYDVSACAPATAQGVVVYDGAPLRHGQFFFRRVQPEPLATVRVPTDGEGRFRTRVPPGELSPMLAIPSDPGPGHVILPRNERWSLAAGKTLELRIEANTRRLRLRLLQPGGEPLANTRLQVRGDGYDRPGPLQTDGQGRVDVVPAPYGAFVVQAKDGGGRDLASSPCSVEPAMEAGVVDVLLVPKPQ